MEQYKNGKDFITTKRSNVCEKTGQYTVPDELFQKRTPRKNSAMIFWKIVINNNMTLEQLQTFEGGVVVFRNNDFLKKTIKKINSLWN